MPNDTQDDSKPQPGGTKPGTESNSNQDTSADKNGGGTSNNAPPAIPAELQAYVNQLVGAARGEGRTAGLTEAQRAEEQKKSEAENTRLREAQQFKELSDRQAADIARLQRVEAEHTTLRTALESELATDLAALDPATRDLMPTGLSVVQQWEFVRKAQRAAAKRKKSSDESDDESDEKAPPGNGGSPPPQRKKDRATLQTQAIEEMRAIGVPL